MYYSPTKKSVSLLLHHSSPYFYLEVNMFLFLLQHTVNRRSFPLQLPSSSSTVMGADLSLQLEHNSSILQRLSVPGTGTAVLAGLSLLLQQNSQHQPPQPASPSHFSHISSRKRCNGCATHKIKMNDMKLGKGSEKKPCKKSGLLPNRGRGGLGG